MTCCKRCRKQPTLTIIKHGVNACSVQGERLLPPPGRLGVASTPTLPSENSLTSALSSCFSACMHTEYPRIMQLAAECQRAIQGISCAVQRQAGAESTSLLSIDARLVEVLRLVRAARSVPRQLRQAERHPRAAADVRLVLLRHDM